MSNKTEIQVSYTADDFRNAFSEGMRNINLACKIYVSIIEESKEKADQLREACADIVKDNSVWARIEMVGRGMAYEKLLYSPRALYAKIARLPVSQQRQAIDNGVELLVGGDDSLFVKASDMTSKQQSQAFAYDHIRSIPEQKAWISRNAILPPSDPQPTDQPWEIKRSMLVVRKPTAISRKELIRILAEIER